ncbi:sensor domain-containing diguanylate cyclase [Silvibacterium dinghuense]|uniref:diguanylate cyclase n=1 Tax=Silvibacterium dinghuense TaxID=1560006 RepID=A0A4Q1SBI6_9BACT|nr:sensor domain-containing diguanylate cyclase [Silvibacterium dinghuense]RXS94486.1 sensor domain-containing diguanylate cyclase [Silvibacterium dinghuense]GGH15791.1 hypothetical protein GCM10011586_37150 [Silvibacterium dinghuense]
MLLSYGSKLMEILRPDLPRSAGLLFTASRFPPLALRWCATGILCFTAGYYGLWLGQSPAEADILWPANGILLAILLSSPRAIWPGYLLAGFFASIFSHRAFHYSWALAVLFSVANTAEILFAGLLLYRHADGTPDGHAVPDITQWKTLRRFFLYGIVLAPLTSVVIVQFFCSLGGDPFSLLGLWNWYSGDALGIAIMTPLVMALQPSDLAALFLSERRMESCLLLFALLALSIPVFWLWRYPMAFILLPPLLLVTFRLRIAGGAIGIFLITIVATIGTLKLRGPFTLLHQGSLIHSIAVLQVYLCALLLIVYSVSAALSQRDRLQEEITRAYRQANELAAHDHTTGIPNRRAFDLELQREWHRAVREQGSISLLMIDIDHFKAYNDYYGHIAGDQCLAAVAALLSRSMMRSSDFVARYGGEEFAVLLPGSHGEGTAIIASLFHQAVRNAAIPHGQSPLTVITVSIGVATLHPVRTMHHSELILAADTALYQAKREGRNRVVIHRTAESPNRGQG